MSTASPADTGFRVRPYRPGDQAAVIGLWHACELVVPWNDPLRDIERKLALQPDGFLVGCSCGELIATLMVGYEGHRGWINYLAVDPNHRYRGVGRAMVGAAERYLAQAGCPKINLQIRDSNEAVIAFYRCLGYEVDPVVSLGKRLQPDN